MPLLCPALSRERGCSCCPGMERPKAGAASGAHGSQPSFLLRRGQGCGAGPGTSCVLWPHHDTGPDGPWAALGLSRTLYCQEMGEITKLCVLEGEGSAGTSLPVQSVKCGWAELPAGTADRGAALGRAPGAPGKVSPWLEQGVMLGQSCPLFLFQPLSLGE